MTYEQELKIWTKRRNDSYCHLMPDKFKIWLQENPEPLMSEVEYSALLNKRIKKVKDINDKRDNVFCPIANRGCVITRESYVPAKVCGTIYEKDWETGKIVIPWISGGRCTAYILKGEQ